jgi:predicted nuclease of predicted toxin-antitoxin system
LRVKLDENLGARGRDALIGAGFDVETVAQERLTGASDRRVLEVATAEGRALVTLDLDFANPVRYPPRTHAGVIVLRLPEPITLGKVDDCLRLVVELAAKRAVAGRLWVADLVRVREYEGGPEPD